MTIRIIRTASLGLPVGTIRTFAAGVEAALIADKEAVADSGYALTPAGAKVTADAAGNLFSDGKQIQAAVSGAWIQTSGVWVKAASIFRLRLTGTGTVTMDSRNRLGVITTGTHTATASGATNQIEFPYAGDDATELLFTFPNTLTVEVI